MRPEVLGLVLEGRAPKGDVLAIARVAAIQAAKRTWELIPLCHPIALSGVEVAIEACSDGVIDAAGSGNGHGKWFEGSASLENGAGGGPPSGREVAGLAVQGHQGRSALLRLQLIALVHG